MIRLDQHGWTVNWSRRVMAPAPFQKRELNLHIGGIWGRHFSRDGTKVVKTWI